MAGFNEAVHASFPFRIRDTLASFKTVVTRFYVKTLARRELTTLGTIATPNLEDANAGWRYAQSSTEPQVST